jgi:hypothetical protein
MALVVVAVVDAVAAEAGATAATEIEVQTLVHVMNRWAVIHATTVANLATGPRTVDPGPRKVRPMQPMKKSLLY